MSASSAPLTFMETELPPIAAETPPLIPFAIDRILVLDPARPAAVLLRERDGERWLPIAIGPAESAQLRAAMASARPLDAEAPRAALISGLAEGVFRAAIITRTDQGAASTPARPADALIEAARHGLPIYLGREVARLACVHQDPEAERHGLLFGASEKHPIASFPYARTALAKKWNPMMARCCFVLFALLTALMIAMPFIAKGGLKTAAGLWIMCIPIMVSCAALLWFAMRLNRSVDETVLEVSPVGLRWQTGDGFKLTVAWRYFVDAGPLWRGVGWRDGLRFLQPVPVPIGRIGKIRMKGFPLAEFDPNWRTGQLGQFVRLYAPKALGITPADREGGSVAF